MLQYDKLLGVLSLMPLTLCADANLSSYVQGLENRIEHLENEKKSKGILNLGSEDTTMFLGGKITLDTIYLHPANGQDGGSNSSDQFFNANDIPTSSEGEASELTLTARNSRFWIKTRTAQADEKPLQTLLEVDFWGSSGTETNSNSHNVRLRHAYMIYNGWVLGQTNSFFVGSFKPHTLLAPVNDVFMRQPLIAYKKELGKSSVAISFEEPESLIMMQDGLKKSINDDRLPDVILKFQHKTAWSEASLSLLARELRIDKEDESSISDTAFGYGLNFTTHIHTYEENGFTFGLVGGKGIGRYMASSFFPSAVITEEGRLEAQRSWGADVAYEHWLSKNVHLNMAWGSVETDNILDIESINKSSWSGHFDLHYTPLKKFLLAAEYLHAERTLQSDESFSLDRVYLRASYNF
jgi:hypothetical protein